MLRYGRDMILVSSESGFLRLLKKTKHFDEEKNNEKKKKKEDAAERNCFWRRGLCFGASSIAEGKRFTVTQSPKNAILVLK